MKRSLLILAITLLLSTLSITAQTFEVKYYLSDFTVTRGADSLVTVTSKHRSFFAGDLQSPQLPFLSANILCAQGVTECNPVFSYEKEPIATGVLLNTIPPAYPTSIDPSTIVYTPQIARVSQSKPYNYEGVGQMMGYSFARIALSPFEYDYDTRTLYFIKSFVITLNERISRQKVSAKNGTKSIPLGDPQAISDIVLNSNEIESMYDIVPPLIKSSEGSLLIITSQDLKEAFMPFVEWKRLKGYTVYIKTVEDIYSQYASDNTNQLKIKKCIYDYFSNHNIDYVLLGADVGKIPTQMCYVQNNEAIQYDKYGRIILYCDTTPCDMYYTCFDNDFDWDANKNGIYGEPVDNIDLEPEIYIGRLPYIDDIQLSNYINKLIDYEKKPSSKFSGINSRLLLVGAGLSKDDEEYIIETCDISRFLAEKMLSDNYISIAYTHFLFNTGINYNDLVLNTYNLSNLIDEGYEVLNVCTHGLTKEWTIRDKIMSNNYKYNYYNAVSQNNRIPMVIQTSACLTNAIDSMCLSKAFLMNINGGAIAYYGTSRNNWHNIGGYYYNLGHAYSRDFLNAYFNLYANEGYGNRRLSLGEIVNHTKSRNKPINNLYTADRWILFSYNLLGDPTFRSLYDCQNPPINLDVKCENSTVNKDWNVVRVYNPSNKCVNVSVISANDFGESYCQSKFNTTSSVISFSNTPKHVRVAIYSDINEPYITDAINTSITGPSIVSSNNRYYIDDLPDEYEVKWSLGSEIKRAKSKTSVADTNDSGSGEIDPGISFPLIDAILYVEENPNNSHECYVKHGNGAMTVGENYEVLLIATIYKDGVKVGTVSKDIIDLSNFYMYVSQDASYPYPGIAQFEVSDNCIESEWSVIEEEDPIIWNGLNSMQRTPVYRDMQNSSDPIFIYKKGKIVFTSPLFKYCTEVGYNYLLPDYINFDKEQQKIELELPYNTESSYSMDLNLYFEDDFPMRTFYLVQVESEEPSIYIIHAFVMDVKVGFKLPSNISRQNWRFEIYNLSGGAPIHTEIGNLSNDMYTVNFFAISGTYILRATNDYEGMEFSTLFTKLPY